MTTPAPTGIEVFAAPDLFDRFYDRSGNCLDPGCDGSVTRPCWVGDEHRSFWVDWDADETGETIVTTYPLPVRSER